MGFVIVSGKNSGYPCQEELSDPSALRELAPPYPDFVFRLHPEVENGYPYMNGMTELCEVRLLTEPFPEWLMAIDSGVNEGYPLCRGLPALGRIGFTKLICAGAPVTELWFGEKPVSAAYLGDETVYIKM
ncbi:MAG: hypothetical protein IJ071_08205 [Ruminococcus sp.]|nr:hypothetical protein [Ruminococcus sp.]